MNSEDNEFLAVAINTGQMRERPYTKSRTFDGEIFDQLFPVTVTRAKLMSTVESSQTILRKAFAHCHSSFPFTYIELSFKKLIASRAKQ